MACFDESLNPVTQTCEMDIVICFFNESKNLVESQYWNSKYLGHGTAADLERVWKVYGGVGSIKNVSNINGWSICQLEIFSSVTKKREEDELPALINIGSCGLHVIHGAFKTGVEATNWNIKKLCVVHSTFCMILQRDEKTMKVLQVAQNILWTSVLQGSYFLLLFKWFTVVSTNFN